MTDIAQTRLMSYLEISKQIVPRIYAGHLMEKYKNTENVFVSFVAVPKLGINPQTEHKTPIGIYCYPVKEAWEKYGPIDNTDYSGFRIISDLPFANKQPYTVFFKVKPEFKHKVLTVNTSEEIIQKYIEKLKVLIPEINSIYKIELNISSFGNTSHIVNTKKFWQFLYHLSTHIAFEAKVSNLSVVVWNKLFRMLDIYGVIDPGEKIIHNNEPCQAVFFSKKAIETIGLYSNKQKIDATKVNLTKVFEFIKHNLLDIAKKEFKLVETAPKYGDLYSLDSKYSPNIKNELNELRTGLIKALTIACDSELKLPEEIVPTGIIAKFMDLAIIKHFKNKNAVDVSNILTSLCSWLYGEPESPPDKIDIDSIDSSTNVFKWLETYEPEFNSPDPADFKMIRVDNNTINEDSYLYHVLLGGQYDVFNSISKLSNYRKVNEDLIKVLTTFNNNIDFLEALRSDLSYVEDIKLGPLKKQAEYMKGGKGAADYSMSLNPNTPNGRTISFIHDSISITKNATYQYAVSVDCKHQPFDMDTCKAILYSIKTFKEHMMLNVNISTKVYLGTGSPWTKNMPKLTLGDHTQYLYHHLDYIINEALAED